MISNSALLTTDRERIPANPNLNLIISNECEFDMKETRNLQTCLYTPITVPFQDPVSAERLPTVYIWDQVYRILSQRCLALFRSRP